MRNKRVFISGGAGIIGRPLVRRLIDEGADIFIGDLRSCPKAWWGKVKYRQGDLNTIAPTELISFSPEIFFHLAATFERSEENYPFFEHNFYHNVSLSHHLLDCLKEVQSLERIVFASSYLIYDPSLYQFNQPRECPVVLKEDSPVHPRNLCGSAKFFYESELNFLSQFFQDRISCVSARIFRVYGEHSRDVISRWVRSALHGEPLSVYCSEGKFDYIFADDVAEGLLRLAKTECRGVINLGSGHSRSIAEVIQILHKYFPKLRVQEIEATIPYECSQASIERLKQTTNWSPTHTLEMGIPKLIEYEKKQLELREKPESHRSASVLITSISKKMPLVEAVRNATLTFGEFRKIHGCDSDAFCIAQYGVDQFWHCQPLEKLTAEQVIAYCKNHEITAIIPTRDADLEFYARYLPIFKKFGIHPMVSSLDAISICLDKKRFADFLLEGHFPAIPTFLWIEDETLTYVVKEKKGAGSCQLGLNLTKQAALEWSKKLKEPIFQPYIKGQEWSVDIYRSFAGHIQGSVARQRNYVVDGESQITTTVRYPELERLCQEMAHYLDLKGHAIFQLIEDENGGFHVIECNPRFGGASTASLAVGLESFLWFFAECLGLSLQDYHFFRNPREVKQIRYVVDKLLPV